MRFSKPHEIALGLIQEITSGNPSYIFPLWETGDNPSHFFGYQKGRLAPQVASTITSTHTSHGKLATFDGNATGHGYDSGITRDCTNISIVAVVQMDSIAATLWYYEIASKGSGFANSSNFAYSLRQAGSGSASTEFSAYTRDSGGSNNFMISTDGLTNSDLDVGRVTTFGLSWKGNSEIEFYVGGQPLGISLDLGTLNALQTSTDPITIGAGSRQTSSSRSWNHHLGQVIVVDGFLSNAEHEELHRDVYRPARHRDYSIGLAPAAGPASSLPYYNNIRRRRIAA